MLSGQQDMARKDPLPSAQPRHDHGHGEEKWSTYIGALVQEDQGREVLNFSYLLQPFSLRIVSSERMRKRSTSARRKGLREADVSLRDRVSSHRGRSDP